MNIQGIYRYTNPAAADNEQVQAAPQAAETTAASPSPPFGVSISDEARILASGAKSGEKSEGASGKSAVSGSAAESQGAAGTQECQTCANRKYKDESNDPTVSFQSATNLSPGDAETAVRAHEQEHVVNEQAAAQQEGRKVVSQNVVIHYSTCPECGRSYVAGGTTTTVTREDTSQQNNGSSAGGNGQKGVDLRV